MKALTNIKLDVLATIVIHRTAALIKMVKKPRSKSLSYSDTSQHPLCLCEYYNHNNDRVHLLMCCCNCEAIDTLCTNLVCNCCQTSLKSNCVDSISDIADRIRYPFPGGARKPNYDFITSLLCVLAYRYIATLNFALTLLTVALVPSALYARFFIARLRLSSRQQLFKKSLKELTTNNSSTSAGDKIQIAYFTVLNGLVFVLYFFNAALFDELGAVMSFTEYQVFNLVLVVAIILHLYLHCADPGFVRAHSQGPSSTSYCEKCSLRRDDQAGHCPVCGLCVARRDHHCFWVDNCIGLGNHRVFAGYLLWLFGMLVYSGLTIYAELKSVSDCGGFSCALQACYVRESRAFLVVAFVQIVPLSVYLGLLLVQQMIF